MGAFEELASPGDIGDRTVALLRRLAGQFTRTHSFPPPQEHERWSDEAVDDLLASMLGAELASKGPAFVLSFYLKATDDASLERLLLAAIRNYLFDEAKGTERGKLRRRLDNLLGQDPRFRRPASSAGVVGWALVGAPDTLTSKSLTDLQRAAFERRADQAWEEPATDPGDGPEVLLVVNEVAEALLRELTSTDRAVLRHLGKPDTDLTVITGRGRGRRALSFGERGAQREARSGVGHWRRFYPGTGPAQPSSSPWQRGPTSSSTAPSGYYWAWTRRAEPPPGSCAPASVVTLDRPAGFSVSEAVPGYNGIDRPMVAFLRGKSVFGHSTQ